MAEDPKKPMGTRAGLRTRDTSLGAMHDNDGHFGADIVETQRTLPTHDKLWNPEEQAKYLEFRAARAISREGFETRYQKLEGEFARYLEDPYTDTPVVRTPVTREVEVLIVGGGWGGLLSSARLREKGFTDIIVCEKGGDVGGTWYWNRYPGIACDVVSYEYLPLLEEMDYYPKMKYSSGFEIMEYCQKVAERYHVYDHALFNTTVSASTWNDQTGRWLVETDRGDGIRAKFVILANGVLTTPKLAVIEGMQTFKGKSFHTSRWDYSVDLRGKTVGILGTGATAIQAVPELAKVVGELFVFQRTPSSLDLRGQRPMDPKIIDKWKEQAASEGVGWSVRRRRMAGEAGGHLLQFMGLGVPYEQIVENMPTLLAESFDRMESIRARVDAVVKDPKTAASLKPYYPYGCKRPCFHDEYLPTFNLPHVHLVDTAPKGIELINERGPVHDGKEYPLDVLIFATGFQWMSTGSFNMIKGKTGEALADKWKREGGTRTLFGTHNAGYPNLFAIAGPQNRFTFNFLESVEVNIEYISWVLLHLRANKMDVVDVTKEDENEYAEHCAEVDSATNAIRNCITYYNGEGTAKPGSLAYYGGANWDTRVEAAKQSLKPYIFSSTAGGYTYEADKPPASRL